MKKGCGCALLIGLVLLALLAWQPWTQAKTPAPSVPANPTTAPATPAPALPRRFGADTAPGVPSALQCKRTGSDDRDDGREGGSGAHA